MKLTLNDTFTRALPADPITENYVRQVSGACYSYTIPTPAPMPELIHVADDMLTTLGISKEESQSEEFLKVFSGSEVYSMSSPYAMCYGGHQFGQWAGQLGDGRAINLFEIDNNGQHWALQLKGAGKTPYSRTADGLAVLRSSVREYLCSEAMHHLGVPTTRALALILSGQQVLRDVLYDGHPAYEKGAIVTRVAPSFIRFGNFQILAARGEKVLLKQLLDYTINQFYPHLGALGKETYLAFMAELVSKTTEMILHWERVGFVHGVMNTDNMSILGLTIDYGPYGWLEDYDPHWTPNTTDAAQRRYRFGHQANIAFWNLYQLANAILGIVHDADALEKILIDGQNAYKKGYNTMMLSKMGLKADTPNAQVIIQQLENILYKSEMDMTLFFRSLSSIEAADLNAYLAQLKSYSYSPNFSAFEADWTNWLEIYAASLAANAVENRVEVMNKVNPKYVLRNYMAQLAIDEADKGNYGLIDELYTLLKRPYDEQPEMEKWFAKRPDWAKDRVGCSQLSCSS